MTEPSGLARFTTPALLVPGDVILGARDGREWTVVDASTTTVTLERGAKRQEVPLARLPEQVRLVCTAAEAHERAVALAQVRLGGQVEGQRDADGPWRVPETFPDVASMLAHLYLFHQPGDRDPKAPAVYPEGPMEALVNTHHSDHQHTLLVPHVHQRGFYRRVDATPAGE